ncbi:hypothetical protein CHS0354_030247 [Potamilus streckersoni]|uniref:Uncharacterized protein n=1 Tax=Potamilus streckersoni TaxID=2493646 RepID=A0AAE0RSL1_9BIVA|nr:hypothetical protein CHS0354_030247 [Potamilus streckersoni]
MTRKNSSSARDKIACGSNEKAQFKENQHRFTACENIPISHADREIRKEMDGVTAYVARMHGPSGGTITPLGAISDDEALGARV